MHLALLIRRKKLKIRLMQSADRKREREKTFSRFIFHLYEIK